MLILPDSLEVTRSEKSEQALTDRCRKWLTHDERKEGLHASDLLDPRQAYYKRKFPSELPDRLVNMFIVGKFAHAIVLSAVDEVKGVNLASDEGSEWSDDLGIWFSCDKTINNIPRELKTTRSFFEAKTQKDLETYLKQLVIYMTARNSTKGQIWILYMNLKDSEGKTAPAWRVFTAELTKEGLEEYRSAIKKTVKLLNEALATDDPSKLEICAAYKCGKGNCNFWDQCRPEGRYGIPKTKWKKD